MKRNMCLLWTWIIQTRLLKNSSFEKHQNKICNEEVWLCFKRIATLSTHNTSSDYLRVGNVSFDDQPGTRKIASHCVRCALYLPKVLESFQWVVKLKPRSILHLVSSICNKSYKKTEWCIPPQYCGIFVYWCCWQRALYFLTYHLLQVCQKIT